MRLISCRTGGVETLGVAAGDRWLPARSVDREAPETMADLLAGGPAAVTRLASAVDPAQVAAMGSPVGDTELLAPVPRPGKIVAIGRNYREHAAEEGADLPT
ncbi:MAG: 5-carboxymethyl-2-hydroxymuconate isomerase, partial [Chloroflexota bacterium]